MTKNLNSKNKVQKSKNWNSTLSTFNQTKAQSNNRQIKSTIKWLQKGKILNKNSWKSLMILVVLIVLKCNKLNILILIEYLRRRVKSIYSQISLGQNRQGKNIRNPKLYIQLLRWPPCSTQRTFLWSKIRAPHSFKTSQ